MYIRKQCLVKETPFHSLGCWVVVGLILWCHHQPERADSWQQTPRKRARVKQDRVLSRPSSQTQSAFSSSSSAGGPAWLLFVILIPTRDDDGYIRSKHDSEDIPSVVCCGA